MIMTILAVIGILAIIYLAFGLCYTLYVAREEGFRLGDVIAFSFIAPIMFIMDIFER